MLFRLLKLFGLDIPAKVEAAKAELAQRVEEASEHIKAAAQQFGVIAALYAIAAVTGALAVAIGLAALCIWVARTEGVYVALAVGGGIMAIACAALALVATAKMRAFTSEAPGFATPQMSAPAAAAAMARMAAEAPPLPPDPALPPPPQATAADLIEPLASILSRYAKIPGIDQALVDQIIAELHGPTSEPARETVERAAAVIREGDRANLIIVLGGAALMGWLLARQVRR
jgi:hypothetical protein